jgi:hypothetical protein
MHLARRFQAVHVDFGTGDGTFVRRTAKVEPRTLFVGVDAISENMREVSRRSGPNSVFGRLALEDAPGELVGFADRLTVLFPWGSLLRAVMLAEPDGLARLRSICRPAADVRFVFELHSDLPALERRYLDAASGSPGHRCRSKWPARSPPAGRRS